MARCSGCRSGWAGGVEGEELRPAEVGSPSTPPPAQAFSSASEKQRRETEPGRSVGQAWAGTGGKPYVARLAPA